MPIFDNLKGALKSRTVWFNLVTGVVEVANLLGGVVPPGTITVVTVVGNVILRFLTKEPLSVK